jgi:large conductance mechanosensitive channel
MFKGFKEFLSRGNIVDLAVAVVIGTAFTALVKSFTDAIIQPLIERIGVKPDTKIGSLSVDIGGPKPIDFNILLSSTIYFILVAFVVYFLVVLPYNTLRKRGEVEQADDAQIVLLTEIRDLLSQNAGGVSSGRHGYFEKAPTPEHGPRADAETQIS